MDQVTTANDKRIWTEADFEGMSWHDNHVHGLGIRSGEYGSGELILDLDHILEWLCPVADFFQFRIAPATLTFREVTNLRIDIDYAAATAALVPFSIADIRRESCQYPGGATGCRWVIAVNWPPGSISFDATGFTQVLRGPVKLTSEQCLDPAERAEAAHNS